jgi:hypothetical protein
MHNCSSLDPMIKGGTLGLLTNIGKLADVHALTGSLLDESFDYFFASLHETTCYLSSKA